MNGLINLYKPSGMSSALAVSKVKRLLGQKTVGHMGTLDPMAEGVLIIGVGKSARLFDYICGHKKTYIAKFKFGYQTDTLDALGAVTETTDDIPSVDAVLNALTSLVGESEQVPPIFSAKHISGKRAYELARSGIAAEMKPVKITVYDAQLVCQPQMDEFVVSITCSAGTYVRAICRDIAKMCGSLATMTYLERTECGIFKVGDSIGFDKIELLKEKALIPPDKALDLPRYDVPPDKFDDMLHGRKTEAKFEGNAIVYCKDVLFGVGCSENGYLNLKTYLKDD